MSTATAPAPGVSPTSRNQPMSPKRLARVTGLLYVVLAALGMLGPLTLESLLVPGDAAATAANISESTALFDVSLLAWVVIVAVDVAVSVTLYLLLAPVSRGHALMAAAFRLVYTAALGALLVHLFMARQLLATAGGGEQATEAQALIALETFSAGFLLALVVFGVHLVLLGLLLHRSHYVPLILGVLLVAAGVGYVVDSLANLMLDGHPAWVAAILLTPAVVGEVGLAFWLLIKGVAVGDPADR